MSEESGAIYGYVVHYILVHSDVVRVHISEVLYGLRGSQVGAGSASDRGSAAGRVRSGNARLVLRTDQAPVGFLRDAAPVLARAFRLHTCSRGVFFFQAEDGIRDLIVTGVQTCALPI